jgi:hypothetical protein
MVDDQALFSSPYGQQSLSLLTEDNPITTRSTGWQLKYHLPALFCEPLIRSRRQHDACFRFGRIDVWMENL